MRQALEGPAFRSNGYLLRIQLAREAATGVEFLLADRKPAIVQETGTKASLAPFLPSRAGWELLFYSHRRHKKKTVNGILFTVDQGYIV